MRDRRIHRAARGEPDPAGGAPPAGISRVRQRRGWRRWTAPGWSLRKKAGPGPVLEEALASEPAPRVVRDQPHPMGHPRAGQRPATPTRTSAATAPVGRGRPQRRDREPRRAPPGAGGRRRRVPEPDRHRGDRPPDRPRAGRRRRPLRRPSSGSCPGSKGPTAWPSSARGARARSSGPGSAARWSSAWARASTCWPATPRRSPRTRPGSRTSRMARSSG